jgi:tight adherence protein B
LDQLWIIYALVFGAVLLAVQATYWLAFHMRSTQTSINRRLALTQQLANPTAVLEALRQERGFADFDNPLARKLSDWLTQTGLQIDRNLLALAALALCGLLFVVLGLALEFGMASFALALVMSVAIVFLWLRFKRSRRIARFADQLPDALDIIVRGVRVGHPFSVALSLVAKEMPDPIGTEFGIAADEIAFGLDVRRAVENLYRRVGQEDLLFVVVSVNVQIQTGGNLAEILSRLSRLIRHRSKVRAKIKSLTAEGRMSAIFLTLMPFILFGAINLVAPGYYGAVRGHPATVLAVVFALTSLAVGNVIMYRMVHFKF